MKLWRAYLRQHRLTVLMLVLFTGLFAVSFALYGLPLDLILYALAMAGGFALAWHLQRARLPAWLCGVLVIAAGIYGAALALFSFAPPDLPIFTPPV